METQEDLLIHFVDQAVHDMRGELSAVSGYAKMMAKILQDRFGASEIPPDVKRCLEALQARSERAAANCAALGLFRHRDHGEFPCSFADVLDRAVDFANRTNRAARIRLLIDEAARTAPKVHLIVWKSVIGLILFLDEVVPPLEPPLRQVSRAGGFDVRDAILSDNAPGGFWRSLRDEFRCRHVVVEFKNYNGAVGKDDVVQLQEYLSRKSLGRFGLLVSRAAPSRAALEARRKAYEDRDVLVLFVDDEAFHRMIHLRLDGKDPSKVLVIAKQQFELSY